MPNQSNVEFVKEFEERTDSFSEFAAKCERAYEYHNTLQNAEHQACDFINQKVMATATSSLKKTDVELKSERQSWRSNNNGKNVITFNHKGMGTLYTGGSYPETYSKDMGDDDLIKVISDPTIIQAITTDLIKQNSMKVLKTFNDVVNIKDHVIKISKICNNYKDEHGREYPVYTLPKSIKVMIPLMSSGGSLMLKEMNVKMLRVETGNSCVLIQHSHKDGTEEDQDDIDEDNIPTGKKYPQDVYRMDFSQVPSALIYMQCPDEFNASLISLILQLDKDVNEINVEMDSINANLSVYSLLQTVKNGE